MWRQVFTAEPESPSLCHRVLEIWGLGFRALGFRLRAWNLDLGLGGWGFSKAWDLGFMAECWGSFRMSFSRFRVAGLGDLGIWRFYGFGFSVQGLGLRV